MVLHLVGLHTAVNDIVHLPDGFFDGLRVLATFVQPHEDGCQRCLEFMGQHGQELFLLITLHSILLNL